MCYKYMVWMWPPFQPALLRNLGEYKLKRKICAVGRREEKPGSRVDRGSGRGEPERWCEKDKGRWPHVKHLHNVKHSGKGYPVGREAIACGGVKSPHSLYITLKCCRIWRCCQRGFGTYSIFDRLPYIYTFVLMVPILHYRPCRLLHFYSFFAPERS